MWLSADPRKDFGSPRPNAGEGPGGEGDSSAVTSPRWGEGSRTAEKHARTLSGVISGVSRQKLLSIALVLVVVPGSLILQAEDEYEHDDEDDFQE